MEELLNQENKSAKPRKPRADKGKHRTPRKADPLPIPNPALSKTLAQIDTRLAELIAERSSVIRNVHAWQGKLNGVNEEIESLIRLQQRMNPGAPSLPENIIASNSVPSIAFAPYSHLNPVPPGAGSIPARQPKPTSPNVAELVAAEGGFR
jgi:hypothetical protein